jgi:nucleoside-diphosphate-sugar epimerase
VTGAAGFVGSHMIPALVARGYEVDAVDTRHINYWPKASMVGVSFMDFSADALDWFRRPRSSYDLVVHLAANVGGRAVIDGRPLSVATNLALDSWLFRWAQEVEPGRVLYFSSSAAYPVHWQQRDRFYRLAEDWIDPVRPVSPDATYGLCKVIGERLALELTAAGGPPVTVVRPFSGYGADQSLDYPWPSFVARAAAFEDPFTVWGDGTAVRDWIHIDDVVEGALALCAAGVAGPVNLCTGVGTSFDELRRMVTFAAGYEPAPDFRLDAPQGVWRRVGDPTLMLEHYVPTRSLEVEVQRAVRAAVLLRRASR